MKIAIQKIYNNPTYTKALHWGKLISMTGGTQFIVQGGGLLAGILIIRVLPTKEYAFYTLANTMLGTMTMLADGGISNGVMAQGGKVWQDRDKLGTVLATGLALRKKFAVISLIFSLPVLASLLIHNGASFFTTTLIILALIPSFFANLTDSLLEIIPKLHQELKPLQKNEIVVSLWRLCLITISLLLMPFTAVAILANGITRIYGNIRMMDIAYVFATKGQRSDEVTRKEIINTVKKVMPITIYYCFSGQIIIWVLSIMGNTSAIAQVGALSRLSMVLNLFSILISTLILPRFARISTDNRDGILNAFMYIQFLLVLMCISIVTIFYLFPDQFLWILGKSYSSLSKELLLMIFSSCIGVLSSSTGNLLGSRGWFINPVIIILVNIVSLIISSYVFNISQITGILYYNILLGVITYIITIIYGLRFIFK